MIDKISLIKKRASERFEFLGQIEAIEDGCLLAWADKTALDAHYQKDSKQRLGVVELMAIEERQAWRW